MNYDKIIEALERDVKLSIHFTHAFVGVLLQQTTLYPH
jgi:hypothetical protein